MHLDFSQQWHVIACKLGPEGGPAAFAAKELSDAIGRAEGCSPLAFGEEERRERIIILDCGADRPAGPGGRRGPRRFSWRASSDRVEIYGEDGAALLRGVYDFLEALGFRWVEPGEKGERRPQGPALALEAASRASAEDGLPATLVIGHGAYLEDWEARLLWAARAGYSSVFFLVGGEELALDAAPESLYEALREGIAQAARRLGLCLELGGRLLGSERRAGLGPCPSNGRALSLAAEAFASYASAHPEISVFHVWPDGPPWGTRCDCPDCSSLQGPAQYLAVARALAAGLAGARPDAALSCLASGGGAELAPALDAALAPALPANLELLWDPTPRSWGSALGDPESALNQAALAEFRASAAAWRRAGGGRVAALERCEDALLFKGAVPPLARAIEGDLEAYRGAEGADAICALCSGPRLPAAPRPNVAILPRLASATRSGGMRALEFLEDWARAAYGKASPEMVSYWGELEAAWAIDLDLREEDSCPQALSSPLHAAMDPPSDWGDPWKAGYARLGEKRDRCEELFDRLRAAEARLAAAKTLDEPEGRVGAEGLEYAISGALLELNCARLSAYHELAGEDRRAAADIANLALSASAAVKAAIRRLPDPRARRETTLLISVFYELRLRAIRRANARSALRRLLDIWFAAARIALAERRVALSYEPGGRQAREPLGLPQPAAGSRV